MIPVTAGLTPTLLNVTANQFDHQPCVNNLRTIESVEDNITLLPSLQQPRKVTIVGSDGKRYIFL